MALGVWATRRVPLWLSLLHAVQQSLGAARYSSTGSRDLRLDLLRGFCVFAMVVDHVSGSSWLYGLTGGNRWVVSAGEGFVFLSGLVAGLVYSRKMLRSGLTATTLALLRRARLLYFVTVAMTLGFVGLAAWTNLSLWVDRSSGLGTDYWAEILVGTLTLRYAYHGSDILALYTILLIVSPGLLFLLREGHVRWVLLGSWTLWAAHALFPGTLQIWDIQNGRYFPLAAWQVLFVTGLVLGYARVRAEQAGTITWQRAADVIAPWLTVAAAMLVTVAWVRALNLFDVLPPSSFRPTGLEHEQWAIGIWDKVLLGPGRIAAFAIVAALAYGLVTVLWRPIDRALGWLLIPLGAGALTAYATHLFIIVAAYNLTALGDPEPGAMLMNTIGQLALVFLVWAVVQLPGTLADTRAAVRSAPQQLKRLPRSLVGCLAVTVCLLLIGQESVLSAPNTPAMSQIQTAPLPAPIWQPEIPFKAPSQSTMAQIGLGDELMVPGLTVATEGPRTLALRGGWLSPRSFVSPTLGRLMPYYVYLPPGYEMSDQSYPVLYLLHGYYGSFMEWAEVGIQQVADELILSGQIQPMIIVMPEGEQSYYVNQGEDGPRWADYLVSDVVREIDRSYRTVPSPSSRAIGGLSMGGTGALYLAFTHPDVFGIVGAHAPTLKWERPEDKFWFADDDYYQQVNPLVLAEELADLHSLTVWLDVGEEDWGWFTVEALHETLDYRDLPHDFYFLEGSHAAEYWVEHQGTYLYFYDQAFRSRALLAFGEHNPEHGQSSQPPSSALDQFEEGIVTDGVSPPES